MESIHHENLIFAAHRELYREYQRCNLQRKLNLKPCLIHIKSNLVAWGSWDQQTRTISISEKLILEHPWHDVIGVLRHEIAHQYVDEILSDEKTKPHGDAFRKSCQKVGVPYFFTKASVHLNQHSLDWRQTQNSSPEEKMLEKVQKLLNLASSSNEHEAVLAMNRVREIYARYNLEKYSSLEKNEEFYHSIIETDRKRIHSYEQKIISLLVNHYMVEVIIGSTYSANKQEHLRIIELIGRRENVLMAEYVFHFLSRFTLELVQQKKKSSKQKISASVLKSFHLGLLTGFDEKICEHAQNQETGEIQKSIQLFRQDPELKKYIAHIHPRLVSVNSQARLRDRQFFELGKQEGRKINIRKPVESRGSGPVRLLK
ncbi:SprT-like domain-containing protein [bacterium]|nr:SprT-like domain-containing protein [bacterium]